MKEVSIHKSLNHENICAFKTYFDDDENLYIVTDLCENGTLKQLLKD